MTTDTKGSALPAAGAVTTGDALIAVRTISGTPTSVTVQAGTAAAKTASDNSKANVASVSGAIVAGHIAVYGDAVGSIIDGGPVPSGGTSGGLVAANNLSDLASASAARGNLGLGALALLGTTSLTANVSGILPIANGGTGASSAGATAANNVGALAIANNLSDLASAGTARSSLGLGSSAVLAAGSANGVATLDSGGKVPTAQLPSAIVNGLEFAGLWNASTNTPTLVSGTGAQGAMYKVSTSGTTNLNGITQWNAGDFAFYDGTTWDKIDGLASEVLSVAGRTGAVTLAAADIAGLGTAATQNTGTFAQATNNLSDLASISTARTNLGLGTAATLAAGTANGAATLDGGGLLPSAQLPANASKLDAAQSFTKQHNTAAVTLTDGATIAWSLDNAQSAKVTLAGNRALANPTQMVDGGNYQLRVLQDATGSRTLSFGTAYKWPGAVAPVLSTGANALDILSFTSDGTSMLGVAQLGFA